MTSAKFKGWATAAMLAIAIALFWSGAAAIVVAVVWAVIAVLVTHTQTAMPLIVGLSGTASALLAISIISMDELQLMTDSNTKDV